MFILFLRLSDNKESASQFMADHKAWIEKGVADGVFLIVGNLEPKLGGAIIATGEDREAFEKRVKEDPFVRENIVRAEVHEVTANAIDARLSFLTDPPG